MHLKTLLATAGSFAALIFATPALAACEDLAGVQLDNGRVTSATEVGAGGFTAPAGAGAPPGVAASPFGNVPAFCRVQMTLTPTSDSDIKSEVWLPLNGWNGKYVGVGNGIWAGSLSYTELGRNVTRNYATAATDTGHAGNGLTAEWAIGHPEKLVDFGHRAVHVTTVAAKAVTERFYGRAPALSLWNSCSTGGRQGLMAAYRYPNDFDAISAMAPANPMTDLMTQSMWQGWQPQRFGAQMTPQVLGMVHAEVLRQCDAVDGLDDGLIGNPQMCRIDLSRMNGLTPAQVQAVGNIYGGVRDNAGNVLLPGWPYGSEMQLALLVMGQEPFPVAMSYFRDLAYAGRSDWNWRTTDYAEYTRVGREYGAEILNVPHDGMGAFFARGGKLLLSHGWGDGLIPANNTIVFHHGLFNALPAAQRDAQLRLFMAPGMDHCSGGEGPSEFDTLGAIDAWASTGVAPERLIATRPTQATGFPGQPPQPPRAPMERPLCAWPAQAVYDGSGDPAVASSFACRVPTS